MTFRFRTSVEAANVAKVFLVWQVDEEVAQRGIITFALDGVLAELDYKVKASSGRCAK